MAPQEFAKLHKPQRSHDRISRWWSGRATRGTICSNQNHMFRYLQYFLKDDPCKGFLATMKQSLVGLEFLGVWSIKLDKEWYLCCT